MAGEQADMLTRRVEALERIVAQMSNTVSGNGQVILSGKVLTVDRTVHVSDLLNQIAALEARIAALEA